MYVSCIHRIFVRNRFELAFINTTEIVLQLYLFPLLCSQVGYKNFRLFTSQIDQSMFTFVNFPRYKVIFSSRVYLGSQPTAQ